jgi:putative methyltransferase (TIGR04325 family)
MSIVLSLKRWLPPPLVRWRRRLAGHVPRFRPSSGVWSECVASVGGYDADAILQRVVQATRSAVGDEGLFERDGVLLSEPAHRFPVLASLLRAAASHRGCLDVVDFGGSLGTSYRQCRPFLGSLDSLRWQVVEQPAFVQAGAEFANEELSFAAEVSALTSFKSPPVILASSVLQYLERPHEVLEQLSGLAASHLVIDRTPLSSVDHDVLTIQDVPRRIYPASYPCWILSRSRLLSQLLTHWNMLAEFDCEEGHEVTEAGLPFEFRGMVLQRKP